MTIQRTTAQFEINISDRSCGTNSTYRTGAQSKISVKIQPSPQTVHPSGKGGLLCLGRKNRAADSNFGEKTASQSRLSKQQCPALTSSIESYDKHLNPPPPQKKNNKKKNTKLAKWTTEIRQGEFIYLILFKKVTFYSIVRFYPSLF